MGLGGVRKPTVGFGGEPGPDMADAYLRGQAERPIRIGRGLEAYKSLRDRTLAYLDVVKLTVPDRPEDDNGGRLEPRLPADITRLSLVDLGKLHGQFVAMAQYASAQLGLVDVDHIEGEYEAIQAEAIAGVEGDNADERKYNRLVDPAVTNKKREALTRKARKVLLGNLVDGYRDAAKCLSREMSRRGIDMEG